MGSARSRRKVLKGMLTFVAGGLGAMGTHPQNAGAARRGYSGPEYGGFTIVVLESGPDGGSKRRFSRVAAVAS